MKDTNGNGENSVTNSFLNDSATKADSVDVEAAAEEVQYTGDVSGLDLPAGGRTGETFEDLSVLEEVDHPLVPTINHSYIKRRQSGNTTDLENITFALSLPQFAVLLEGETGVGKDFALAYIASKTNRPMITVNFGVGTTYEDLVGMFEPKEEASSSIVGKVQQAREALEETFGEDVPISDAIEMVAGAESNFGWNDGLLTWAVKNGAVFHGAEINAAGGEATMPLHGVTEEEGKRYLTLKQKGEVITDLPVTEEEIEAAGERHGVDIRENKAKAAHMARADKWEHEEHYGNYIHPQFRFVGSMNPPTYAGTKELNDAFKSRFVKIPIDYLPKRAEKALMFETTPFKKNDADDKRAVDKITDILENLRNSYKDMDIVTPISHREAIKVGLYSQKMAPKNACKFVLGGIAAPEDKSKIVKLIDTTKF